MSLQYSVAVRTAQQAAIESTIGTSPKLQLRTGSPPANCAAADAGSLLAELTLPSDWAGQSSGQLTLSGTWSGTATGTGTAAHFRLKDSSGATCHMQGTVTITGGGGDLTADNPSIANGQAISVTGFTITRNNL